MTNYKTLIEQIKSGESEPSPLFLKAALREIYFEKDVKSAIELTNSLSEYYVEHYDGYDGHYDAYSCVRAELDSLAEEADYLFRENGNIQRFYRNSILYYKDKED